MNTIDRLEQFIEFKGISRNAFDKKINAGNGYIGKMISRNKKTDRKSSIGSDILEKIFSVFPELNPTWLLTGREDMMFDNEKEDSFSNLTCPFSTRLDLLEKEIKKIKEVIEL